MVVSIARHSEGFLAVRFPFDREVVDAMSTVPGRRWSAGDQAWLIPKGRVEGDRLLDALYNTGMFSLSDSRDAKPAVFFDETLQTLGRALESRHYSPRTIQVYAQWVRRFLDRHKGRALASLGEKDINALLFLIQADFGNPGRRAGRGHPRQEADTPSRGHEPGRGQGRPIQARRGQMARRSADVRHGHTPHGVLDAYGSGYRLREERDPGAKRQRR